MMIRVLLLLGAIHAGHHIQPRHEARYLRVFISEPCTRPAHQRPYQRVECIDGQVALRARSYARNAVLDRGAQSDAHEVIFRHAEVIWRAGYVVVNRT